MMVSSFGLSDSLAAFFADSNCANLYIFHYFNLKRKKNTATTNKITSTGLCNLTKLKLKIYQLHTFKIK